MRRCSTRVFRSGRSAVAGFSLIELVICLAILAVLLSILLPATGRAREMARRTTCAANLRSISQAATSFAQRNTGVFPMSFTLPDPAYPFKFPMVISTDASLANDGRWTKLGTPFQQWESLGATDGVWNCASSESGLKRYEPGVAPAEWGSVVMTDYMYVGGITTKNLGKSVGRWGILEPAVTLMDKNPSQRVLAADAVFFTGGSSFQWDRMHSRRHHINHPKPRDPTRVEYQAVVFADGHVEGFGSDMYPGALTTGNYSLLHSNNSVGGFMYWGAAVSYTPGKAIPPPNPTPTPPAPTPTPTPTPKPPNPNPPPPPPPPILPNPLP